MSRESGIDINLRIEALRRARTNNGIGRSARIEKSRCIGTRKTPNRQRGQQRGRCFETGLLAYALSERIASARLAKRAISLQMVICDGIVLLMIFRMIPVNAATIHGLGKKYFGSPFKSKRSLPMVKEQEIIT